jgi:hypothetical protein
MSPLAFDAPFHHDEACASLPENPEQAVACLDPTTPGRFNSFFFDIW